MSSPPTSATPQRGRPRSEKAHNAILKAAAELLLEKGLAAVSMDAVAARAGVSKATIYRWWPSKETLALEAVYRAWSDVGPPQPDTGSLRGDLRAMLLPWARRLRERPYGRVIAAFITEAQTDPAFEEQYRTGFVEPRRALGRAAVARPPARRRIPPGAGRDRGPRTRPVPAS